jgi:hypothetical protein
MPFMRKGVQSLCPKASLPYVWRVRPSTRGSALTTQAHALPVFGHSYTRKRVGVQDSLRQMLQQLSPAASFPPHEGPVTSAVLQCLYVPPVLCGTAAPSVTSHLHSMAWRDLGHLQVHGHTNADRVCQRAHTPAAKQESGKCSGRTAGTRASRPVLETVRLHQALMSVRLHHCPPGDPQPRYCTYSSPWYCAGHQ